MDVWKQRSKLCWSDHPDHALQDVIDWGERTLESGIGSAPFFTSAAWHEDWLHLLARGDTESSPAWIAVNPHNWETRVLVDKPDNRYSVWYGQRLVSSPRHGLVLISQGKAYRVELPAMDRFPLMPSEVHGMEGR